MGSMPQTNQNQTGSSGSAPRRKQHGRVARLLKPNNDLDKVIDSATKEPPKEEVPSGEYSCEIRQDSICFKLSPRSPKFYCPFQFMHSPQHRVVLTVSPTSCSLPFVLNNAPFHYNGTEIDITEQLSNGQNALIFNTMEFNHQISASIEWREANTVDSVLYKVLTQYEPMEMPADERFITDICPISKEQIKYAGRGVHCNHPQCFDLTAFISRGLSSSNWACPVCNVQIPIEDLRHDPGFLKQCKAPFVSDDYVDNSIEQSYFYN